MVVQEAEVCSLSIKSRFLEFIRRRPGETGADRGRPEETGGVPGYGVKDTQADPPHPRAKARMTALKQTPSNQASICQVFPIPNVYPKGDHAVSPRQVSQFVLPEFGY